MSAPFDCDEIRAAAFSALCRALGDDLSFADVDMDELTDSTLTAVAKAGAAAALAKTVERFKESPDDRTAIANALLAAANAG